MLVSQSSGLRQTCGFRQVRVTLLLVVQPVSRSRTLGCLTCHICLQKPETRKAHLLPLMNHSILEVEGF